MGCSRGGCNRGTLKIPREDWGTLGKIRGITTPPLRIRLNMMELIDRFSKFRFKIFFLGAFFFLVENDVCFKFGSSPFPGTDFQSKF